MRDPEALQVHTVSSAFLYRVLTFQGTLCLLVESIVCCFFYYICLSSKRFLPDIMIHGSIPDSLKKMRCSDLLASFQIRNRSGHPDDPVISSGTESQRFKCLLHNASFFLFPEDIDSGLHGRQLRIKLNPHLLVSFLLTSVCRQHPTSNRL